jgi:tetratricopeptide (TPR) repeat protein
MVRESGFDLPVLSDTGDGVYASLGLSLHPVVVIVDRERKLAAFEPFRSVNFCDVVSAQLRHVLREISDEELRAALDPQPSTTRPGAASGGKRYRSLAEALLKAGNHDKAIQNARKSIELERGSADGHALLGRIFFANGDCSGAVRAFEAALAVDIANVPARAGIADCSRKR